MVKNYVLDTNVLLYDPSSIFKFEDNNIYIPLIVLEEIDSFKKRMDNVGHNAREIARTLDELSIQNKLNEGVEINDGKGKLYVTIDLDDKEINADKKILKTASNLSKRDTNKQTVLVTKDINLRVRAGVYNLCTEDYKNSCQENFRYDGFSKLLLSENQINDMNELGSIDYDGDLIENQYYLLTNESNLNHKSLSRVINGKLSKINNNCEAVSLRSKNMEQAFALNALLDDDVKLVTLNGISGTGKTILAVASALQKTIVENEYDKITITRPVVPVGNDLGYIPGSIQEKYEPWIKPIKDSIDVLTEMDRQANTRTSIPATFDYEDNDVLQVMPLNFIRGRSLPKTFMIIDECQNLTPLEIKTIVTRVGQGTKVVLVGDIDQIDHPYLDHRSNGLTHLINSFKGQDLFAHVTLKKGERSKLAEIASNVL